MGAKEMKMAKSKGKGPGRVQPGPKMHNRMIHKGKGRK